MRQIATVNRDGLNLHEAAGAHSRIKTALARSDRLEVLGRGYPGGYEWLKVRVLETRSGLGVGQEGWVFAPDVEIAIVADHLSVVLEDLKRRNEFDAHQIATQRKDPRPPSEVAPAPRSPDARSPDTWPQPAGPAFDDPPRQQRTWPLILLAAAGLALLALAYCSGGG